MPSFPLEWNPAFTSLQPAKSPFGKHYCWFGLIVWLTWFGFFSAYNPIVFNLVTPVKNYDKLSYVISTFGSLGVAGILLAIREFTQHFSFNLATINQLLNLSRLCSKLKLNYYIYRASTPDLYSPTKLNWDVLTSIMIPLCLSVLLWIPVALVLNFDWTHF